MFTATTVYRAQFRGRKLEAHNAREVARLVRNHETGTMGGDRHNYENVIHWSSRLPT